MNKKSILKLITILCFAVAMQATPSNAQKIKKNDTAPDFKGITTTGEEFHLQEALKERYVLVNITAINCGWCWRIYPHLALYQEKYKDELQIVNVYYKGDTHEKWEATGKGLFKDNFAKLKQNITSVWDAVSVQKQYHADGFPHFFLVNKEGIVVNEWFGGRPEKLGRVLDKQFEKK